MHRTASRSRRRVGRIAKLTESTKKDRQLLGRPLSSPLKSTRTGSLSTPPSPRCSLAAGRSMGEVPDRAHVLQTPIYRCALSTLCVRDWASEEFRLDDYRLRAILALGVK